MGDAGVQTMARSIDIEWTQDALAELDRFALFLKEHFPHLADRVAHVLQVLNAPYVFEYRFDGERVVMLRVFHGREKRD